MEDRYWFDNSLADEGDRLRLLEAIADPRSIRLLDGLGVGTGWRCAELGAGGGSIASWLAQRVGASGSVLAVDRDVTLLGHLSGQPTIDVVRASIEDIDLAPASFDLIHTRNVLMHMDAADGVMARLVDALRPGGALLVEEADYFPLAGMTSPALVEVAAALVSRWTWARTIPRTLARLAVDDLEVTVDASMLQGGSGRGCILDPYIPVGRGPAHRSRRGQGRRHRTREPRDLRDGDGPPRRRDVLDPDVRGHLRRVPAEVASAAPPRCLTWG